MEHEVLGAELVHVRVLKPDPAPAAVREIDHRGGSEGPEAQVLEARESLVRREVDHIRAVAEIGDPVGPVIAAEDEPVGAGAAGEPVVALAADQQVPVAAFAALKFVVALAAEHPVGAVPSLHGGDGDDVVHGNAGRDVISGGEGQDILRGGDGGDWITGGDGDDRMWGGADRDVFVFGPADGHDTIHDFDTAGDRIYLDGFAQAISWEQLGTAIAATEDGRSTVIDLTGWGGGTIVLADVAASSLTAGMFILPGGRAAAEADGSGPYYVGDDLIVGRDGDDSIDGADGHDTAFGAEGDDDLTGGAGHDWLFGGEGDDTLDGGDGNDRLIGGEGADMLAGGDGDDTLTGGAGADSFVYQAGHGNDRITDFTDGEDAIALDSFAGIAGFEDLAVTQVETDVAIDLSDHGGGTLTLENLALDALDGTDFLFYRPLPAEPVQDGL